MTYLPDKPGLTSILNSTFVPLSASQIFQGTYEDVADYSMITVFIGNGSPAFSSGIIRMEFSMDKVSTDNEIIIPINNISNPQPGIHSLTPIAQYWRVSYENGNIGQNSFRLQTTYHKYLNQLPVTPLAQITSLYSDAQNVRSIIHGIDSSPSQSIRAIKSTTDGHLKTSILGPVGAFGELDTVVNTSMFNLTYQHAVLPPISMRFFLSGSGYVEASDGELTLSTGTSILSTASVTSRRSLQYIAGLGNNIRFSSKFGTPFTGSQQTAGLGHSEEGLFFGYLGNNFGVLHRRDGRRPLHAYTVTSPSTTITNITVSLNGDKKIIPVTNNNSTTKTANEISYNDYKLVDGGFETWTSGSVIYFMSIRATTNNNFFSITGELFLERLKHILLELLQ